MGVQASTTQALKDELHMLVMFFLCARKYQYINSINHADNIEEVAECVLKETLKDTGSLSKTKRHNVYLKRPRCVRKVLLPEVTLQYTWLSILPP